MRRWIGIAAAVVLLLISAAAGSSLSIHSGQVFLHYGEKQGPETDAMEKMVKQEKEEAKREIPRLAGWKMENGVEIKNLSLGKKVLAECMTIYGEKDMAAPLALDAGTFGYPENKEGCVVSRGLAMELFGSGQVLGMEILCMGKTYKICGVLKEKKKLVLLPSEKQESLEYLLFDYGTEGSGKMEAESLLFRYGIDSNSLCGDGALFCAGSGLFLCMAIASFFFCGLCEFKRQYKELDSMDMIPIFLILFSVLLCFFLFSRRKMAFPQDLIPTRWSDFDFWVKKYKEIGECFSRLIQNLDVYWVDRIMKKAAVGMGTSLVSASLIIKMTIWPGRA